MLKAVNGRLLLAGLLISIVGLRTAVAKPGPAVTNLADVDGDFAVMGEYSGQLLEVGSAATYPAALQVVALGNGEFRAALLRGGLPGNGWDRSDRVELKGQREGDVVKLTGDAVELELQGNSAKLSSAGQSLGVLGKVVRRSAHEGLLPPPNSIVLFDGRDTQAFKNAKMKDGLLQIGTELLPLFRNFQLHVEFMTPYMPAARGQDRGNSGVYIHSRYEVQVLDSFGLKGAFNECGSLYRQRSPDLNMAFPPLSWQTYDITFHAPIFDAAGNKCRNARITLLHNGVPIHDNVEIVAKTGAGKAEGPDSLPIKLQDHGNPVQFRNLWLIELP
ncbi:MAG: DUF1080 domain-containing protein [Planctomycetales bacterium]|nr:DUF1080 domain-containing protein [Planctomycetales bacterium]MCA9167648.1 DUF1080 domain-containing protein [Planctomycetales bacterium]